MLHVDVEQFSASHLMTFFFFFAVFTVFRHLFCVVYVCMAVYIHNSPVQRRRDTILMAAATVNYSVD